MLRQTFNIGWVFMVAANLQKTLQTLCTLFISLKNYCNFKYKNNVFKQQQRFIFRLCKWTNYYEMDQTVSVNGC